MLTVLLGSACTFIRPPEELAHRTFAECTPHAWGGWHVVWPTADTAAPLEIAWWWAENGRPEQAVATLGLALEYLPDEPSLLEARGALHHGLRFHRAAEVDFRKLSRLRPSDAGIWRALARIQLGLSLPTRAIEAIERARRLGDQSPDSYEIEARARRAAGDHRLAWEAYEHAIEGWELPVPELRLEAATLALSVDPDRLTGQLLLGALTQVEAAREHVPDDARVWLLRALLLESRGSPGEAVKSYLRACDLDRSEGKVWGDLARLGRRIGDPALLAGLARCAAGLRPRVASDVQALRLARADAAGRR